MSQETESSSESEGEDSLNAVMAEFKDSMAKIEAASNSINLQVTDLYARAKKESVDWLNEPLRPKPLVRAWLKERGLPTRISIDEFLEACYAAARTMDLESRMLTFGKTDAAALWGGQRRLSVFDIVARIPDLFE